MNDGDDEKKTTKIQSIFEFCRLVVPTILWYLYDNNNIRFASRRKSADKPDFGFRILMSDLLHYTFNYYYFHYV